MECADVVPFTLAAWQIRSCLLCKLISPCQKQLSWIYLLLQVSLVGWGKWSELFGCFVAGSSEIRENIRICWECKDYVIGREITTELKITVDNAILECDLYDFFASPLLKWCGVYRNQRLMKDCFGMCTAPVKNPFFTTNSSLNICKFVFLRKVNDMTFYAKPTLCKECN